MSIQTKDIYTYIYIYIQYITDRSRKAEDKIKFFHSERFLVIIWELTARFNWGGGGRGRGIGYAKIKVKFVASSLRKVARALISHHSPQPDASARSS